MNNRSHKKMLGINVYICINNIDVDKEITIGKPYRILAINRDHLYNLFYYIKNNKRQEMYYPAWRFRPRNSKDDRRKNSNE